jgi:AraC family transcriptional regulator
LLSQVPTSIAVGFKDVGNHRRCLIAGDAALVEDSALSSGNPIARGYSSAYQIALPYFGAFTWSVGGPEALIDPTRILFIRAGEEFGETHPVPGIGHASIVITPKSELLDELCDGVPPHRHLAFRGTSRPANARVRLLAHWLLAFSQNTLIDPITSDEMTLAMLREILDKNPISCVPIRIVEKAKRLLHEHCCETIRLDDIARALRVSAVYLTQAFTRAEGMPLYRYLMQLRLNLALSELPNRESLTDLALDLGFSSHSHFTAAFRSTFGLTPSEFRSISRNEKAAAIDRLSKEAMAIKYPSSARR